MTTLLTTNLILAPCTPRDRDDFMDLERDPEVMRFLSDGTTPVAEQSQPDSPYLMPRGTEDYVWTARRTSIGAFVGWFCLWPEQGGVAELGYRLRRSEWGQGLASEGAIALVNWGFATAGYEKVTACTMTTNLASRRVMEKTGLKYTHTNVVDWTSAIPDGDQGEVNYEVTRLDWTSQFSGVASPIDHFNA